MKGVLRIRHRPGRSDVVLFECSYNYYEEPTRRVMLWETGINPATVEDGQPAEDSSGNPAITYRDRLGRICHRQSGNASASAVEIREEPIPLPATKLKTRFRYGRWEKKHPRRGWIPA